MRVSRKLMMFLGGTASIAIPQVANAQNAMVDPNKSEEQATANGEIIVTAQKRSERLSDVPLSVAAASGETLVKAGVTSAADLGKIVPGFTYQPSNFGPPVYSIRGVGFFDNTVASSPTVSVYVDQVSLPYLAMTAGVALDLERVEVLKGPQGTLFGQNATGGAINFIAAKPTKEWSMGGSAEYARFNQVNVGGFLSGPISETLKVRLAARTEQGGAWQTSATRPGDELGNRNFTTARLLLDWEPSDAAHFTFNANGWIDKSETTASQYVRYLPQRPRPSGYTEQEGPLLAAPAAPRNSRVADWDDNTDLRQDNQFYQLSLSGEFKLSDLAQLTTISAYSHLKFFNPTDVDGTSFNNFLTRPQGKIDTFSHEVRLSGKTSGGDLRWMLGGYYSHVDSDENAPLHFTASNNGVGTFRYNDSAYPTQKEIETISAFGSLDYNVSQTISAQVSARYTDEYQKSASCLADSGNGAIAAAFSALSTIPFLPGECVTFLPSAGPPPYTPVGGPVRLTLAEDNLSWRGNVSWRPNSDVHIYTNITKGYKSGSFSRLPLIFSDQFTPVPQESVLAYEVGFKVSALNRSVNLSGAAFYYDYKDKQLLGYILTPFGNLPGLVTVPKSRVAGGEINLNWRPVSGLALNGGVTYVNSKITKSYTTKDPYAADIDIKGYSFPITPEWQASGSADYAFPVAENLNVSVGTNITYRSRSFATFGGGAEFVLPAYTLVDLHAGIERGDGRWRAEIWGRNVFNTFYLVNANHVSDTVARVAGKPATYGVTLSFKY